MYLLKDILRVILYKLSLQDIANFSLTCKEHHQLLDETFWRNKIYYSTDILVSDPIDYLNSIKRDKQMSLQRAIYDNQVKLVNFILNEFKAVMPVIGVKHNKQIIFWSGGKIYTQPIIDDICEAEKYHISQTAVKIGLKLIIFENKYPDPLYNPHLYFRKLREELDLTAQQMGEWFRNRIIHRLKLFNQIYNFGDKNPFYGFTPW